MNATVGKPRRAPVPERAPAPVRFQLRFDRAGAPRFEPASGGAGTALAVVLEAVAAAGGLERGRG